MDLNQQIDTAQKFTPPPATEAPVVDQSGAARFALDWASRQADRPPAPEPAKMPPIVPVAS